MTPAEDKPDVTAAEDKTVKASADASAPHHTEETAKTSTDRTATAGADRTAKAGAERAVTVGAAEAAKAPGPEGVVAGTEPGNREPASATQAQAGQSQRKAKKNRKQAGLAQGQPSKKRERTAPEYEQVSHGLGRAGWVFGAMTVVPAMLAAAWLLPSLPLLLTGRLSAQPMVFMFIPLAGGLCYFAVRRLPASWPAFRSASTKTSPEPTAKVSSEPTAKTSPEPKARTRTKPGTPWWTVAATLAVAIVFTAWQITEHTQQIIYLRDPATYLQVGYWIAHHGYLPIPDSAAAFGGPHPYLSFASSNYYPRGTGIVPQFMTGMPLVIAAALWLKGIPAALVVTPVIGGCAVLSFGGLVARLAGPRWAPAAAAVLALSLPEQYTSRSTFSEPLAQVLLFGGLCLLADSLAITRSTEGARSTGSARSTESAESTRYEDSARYSLNQDMVLAALGGLALGLTILVRVDGLSDILPAVPFVGVLLAARSRRAIPFAAGLVIGVGYGLADGYLKSRPYLDLEAPSLRPLGYIVAVTLGATVALVIATASPAARRRLSRIKNTSTARWLPAAAAVLTTLIFIGFAIRPLVQTVRGETIPASIAYVAELQKLAGLPVDGRQQYYEDSLYWVIWYLGVPAVLLGALGLAALARRATRALIQWDDPRGAARAWALPLMIALWVIVTVLYRPAVAPDQPWASRRLVPFVLPGVILGAIWAATWLKDQAAQLGRTRTTAAIVAACGVASLLIPTALTTLDLSFTKSGVNAHGMAFRKIGPGELGAVNDLCGTIGPEASVVILDQLTADRFAQVIRGMCGVPAAVLTNAKDASQVDEGIETVGRRTVFLAGNAGELPAGGTKPTEVVNLLTTQEAHNLTAPPTRTWGIHYTVWMSVPVETGG